VLGQLAESVVFKYSGGWGDWPPEAVKALVVLQRLDQEVDAYYRKLAEFEDAKADAPPPPMPIPPGKGQAALGMTDPQVAQRKAESLQRFYASASKQAKAS
jgi:hypothetical protein